MIGAACGWSSPIINSFKNSSGEFSLTEEDCSWIASLHYVGRATGCLMSAAILDRVGRISLLSASSFLTLLIWASILLTKKVLLHYAIRFVFGLSVGIVDTAMPVYVAENSSPNLRGIFFTIVNLFFFGGELFAFLLATYTSYETVAVALTVAAVVNLSSAFLFKEPAQYLIMKGQEATARTHFQWFRGNTEKLTEEFDEMKTKLATVNVQFSWRMFVNRQFRIVAAISTLTYLTGFPALNALLAFALIPTATFSCNELTVFVGVALLIGPFLSATIVERYGRRTLFIGSMGICALANVASASLHYCLASAIPVPGLAWLLLVSVTVYSMVFAAIIFSLLSITRGELLPPELKAAGVSASVILNSATGFLVTHIFLYIADAFGMMMNFIFFALASLITLLYVYFYLPETRGMTLMEIQKLFDK